MLAFPIVFAYIGLWLRIRFRAENPVVDPDVNPVWDQDVTMSTVCIPQFVAGGADPVPGLYTDTFNRNSVKQSTICPSSDPFYVVPYKMGHYFLD